ncbi:MAG: hypothetical protein ACYTBS_09385 [Planctomycetota bacterium]|jgi:hypothetical protein
MTGNIERSAWILSLGVISAAIILSISMAINTSKLSKSLVSAGERSRSHSSSSFPSELRVQVSETSMDLQPERKSQLKNAFVKACIGQVYDNKTVEEIQINRFEVKVWGSNLSFFGNIVFSDGSVHEGYEAHLHRDGFGGYEGFVRAKNGGHLIIKDIQIR